MMTLRERTVRAALVTIDCATILYVLSSTYHSGLAQALIAGAGVIVTLGAITHLCGVEGRLVDEGWFANGCWLVWVGVDELASYDEVAAPAGVVVAVALQAWAIAAVCFTRFAAHRHEEPAP